MTKKQTPFFERFLTVDSKDQETVKAGATMKYPSDSDEVIWDDLFDEKR